MLDAVELLRGKTADVSQEQHFVFFQQFWSGEILFQQRCNLKVSVEASRQRRRWCIAERWSSRATNCGHAPVGLLRSRRPHRRAAAEILRQIVRCDQTLQTPREQGRARQDASRIRNCDIASAILRKPSWHTDAVAARIDRRVLCHNHGRHPNRATRQVHAKPPGWYLPRAPACWSTSRRGTRHSLPRFWDA